MKRGSTAKAGRLGVVAAPRRVESGDQVGEVVKQDGVGRYARLGEAGPDPLVEGGVLAAHGVVASFLPDVAKAAVLAEIRAQGLAAGAAVPALARDTAAV